MPQKNPETGRRCQRRGVKSLAQGRVASTLSLSVLREQADGLRRAQQMAGLAHVVTAPDGSFESWSETLPEFSA